MRALHVLGVVVLVAGAGAWWATRPEPIAIETVPVERGAVEASVANTRAGTVQACRRARLSLSVGGQIQMLAAREGARVVEGQTLLSLWNADLRAQLDLAEREVGVAQASADEACALAELAERDSRRLERLQGPGAVSEEEADQARVQVTARRAACRAARMGARMREASVDVVRAHLERTILRAPFAGTVAEVNGELSEYVTPSPIGVATPPAVDLVDTSCLYVSAPMDEVDAPRIVLGMPARISLDAFPARTFEGRVRRIAPYVLDVEAQARTVEVEVEFSDAGAAAGLLPGYSADAEVLLERREDALRVPTEAVAEGPRVLVLGAAGDTLETRDIEVGISSWRWTEVTGGLEPGERVAVTLGREGVEAGARVRDTAAAP